MIEIKNLSKMYITGLGYKKALDHIDLTIGPGEIIGLFGKNGAGKTTLMKCMLNLLRYEGSIFLDGERISHKNLYRLSFATSEHSFFPGLSAHGHKEFYKDHFPLFLEKRFDGLMDFFDLPMEKPIRSFSTGQKNQFEIILALCQGADYILMDEPFAGNDIFNREDFYKLLMGILEPHETLILSTHLVEEVSGFVSRAILIDNGKILADLDAQELEQSGKPLTEHIKQAFSYQADRVSKALGSITGEEEQ